MSDGKVDPRAIDQTYLVSSQYSDGGNLGRRANLHEKYGRGDWFAWHASQFSWSQGADVLEVGCGPGAYWIEAKLSLPPRLNLTLTDLSPGMVEAALLRVRDAWPSATAAVANASDLPFNDATFDVVVANHMLYHVPEPALAVAEIWRVLRPGGTALVATNGLANMRTLLDLRGLLVRAGEKGEVVSSRFSVENGEPILRAAFFSVELRRYPDALRCTNPQDVLAYLTSFPPGSDASTDQFAKLRAAVDIAFHHGGGVLTVEKDVGLFLCRK